MSELSLIIGYRDRDLKRVERCLDSLDKQTDQAFELIFLDYGSSKIDRSELKSFVEKYSFTKYHYSWTQGWFWNRSHALNTGVKLTENNEFIVTTDVDLIFPPKFISELKQRLSQESEVHVSARNLPKGFSSWERLYSAAGCKGRIRAKTALGLVQGVSRCSFFEIRGFDEYYRIWGVEDEDLNRRFQQNGIQTSWIELTQPIYHQWHPESGSRSFNVPSRWQEHLVNYKEDQVDFIKRNDENWGKLITNEMRPALQSLHNHRYDERIDLSKMNMYNALFELVSSIGQRNKTFYFKFEPIQSLQMQQSSLVKFIDRMNRFLNRCHSPLLLTNDLLHFKRIQDEWDFRDVIAYFTLKYRQEIVDYHLDFTKGSTTFILAT